MVRRSREREMRAKVIGGNNTGRGRPETVRQWELGCHGEPSNARAWRRLAVENRDSIRPGRIVISRTQVPSVCEIRSIAAKLPGRSSEGEQEDLGGDRNIASSGEIAVSIRDSSGIRAHRIIQAGGPRNRSRKQQIGSVGKRTAEQWQSSATGRETDLKRARFENLGRI